MGNVTDYLVVDNLVKGFGDTLAVDGVSFSVGEGEMVTLLGPSGCGKSTTLRCVAGLETFDGGDIFIGGALVSSAGQGLYIAPEHRHIGMVFQSYAVWPHMSVRDNVAYPLRFRGVPKQEMESRVRRMLDLVGLAGMEDRNVTKLSGGQQQRVVLARAMVGNPSVLLLDEPLSNLDARLRESMRFEIRRLQQEIGVTALYVTHDQSEAMVISDRVIVMSHGHIEQIGAPLDIYRRPVNSFVASFFGDVNFIEGTLGAFNGSTSVAPVEIVQNGERMILHSRLQPNMKPGERVRICVRPEDVDLGDGDRPASGNAMRGKVSRVVQMGSHVEYHLKVGDQTFCCREANHKIFAPDADVWIVVKSEAAICVAA